MPTDRPNAAELLRIARMHLQQHTAPLLEGHAAFQLRIAVNVLQMVERTLAEGEAMDRAELRRLCALLGLDDLLADGADDSLSQQQVQAQLLQLNRQLAAQIRSGDWSGRSGELLQHLKATAADKLRLAWPDYSRTRD